MSSDVIKRADPTDDYELLHSVGKGNFGEVYKARHIRTGQLSAIKVIKLEAGDDFSIIQQEIHMLRECVHPNIISYYGSYLRREKLWICMEYCSAGSLQDIYHMTGPLTELQIAFVCREILKGLDYLHGKGKIHRDVKGANILLSQSGDVKLADFGVAAQITATIGKRMSFIGTPYWMAPEVANVEEKGGYSFQVDIWAVGITAIELAETRPPHLELQPMQVLRLMTKSSYKIPKLKDKKKWSAVFHDFIKSCLVKNPKKRPLANKLLDSHLFVCGSLSSRFTRELLDRVNNPESGRSETRRLHDSLSNYSFHANEFLGSAFRDELGLVEYITTTLSDDDTETESTSSEKAPNSEAYHNDETISAHPSSAESSQPNGLHSSGVIELLEDRQSTPIAKNDRTKLDRSVSVELLGSQREEKPHNILRPSNLEAHNLFGCRPSTCYGLVPTPQVSMGACFLSVFHDCRLQTNSTGVWVNSANKKQYLIIGAEEGIFALNLTDMYENTLQQISDRRCGWIHVIGDVMIALQGKTPYLYRHDILQLMHQQFILQKCSKTLTKIPDKFVPKAVKACFSFRIAETKDVFKCTVERGLNGNLYMCCATPTQILLFQWFEPRQSFLLLKTAPNDSVTRVPLSPFNLVFGVGALNSDYPQVCIGVYEKSVESAEGTIVASPNAAFEYRLVDFNDNGRLEDFMAKSANAELYDSLRPLGMGSRPLSYSDRPMCPVVAFKQLDRDTFFLAYRDEIVITDAVGRIKKTDLMRTSFEFDFTLSYAVPLADSVLAFYSHGVTGKSFFNGAETQNLCDESKIFDVIGMIVLRSTSVLPKISVNPSDHKEHRSPLNKVSSFIGSGSASSVTGSGPPFDIVVLTGHVSTLNTP